jgi:hypothetical protein
MNLEGLKDCRIIAKPLCKETHDNSTYRRYGDAECCDDCHRPQTYHKYTEIMRLSGQNKDGYNP